MQTVIILGILSMFFAWLEGHGLFKHGLKVSFGLIFIFSALRYDYGNDYNSYLTYFDKINANGEIGYFNPTYFDSDFAGIEVGWVFLNRVFSSLGFFALVGAMSLFNCIIYYRFIKKYVPLTYYWLAIFIYTFSPFIMLIQLSAMRQSIAISLFILSIDYLINKKIIYFYIITFIAICFHSSALILLPLYFIRPPNMKLSNYQILTVIFTFFLVYFSISFLTIDIANISNLLFSRYSVYLETQNIGIGFTIIFSIFLMVIILKQLNKQNYELKQIYILTLIGIFLIPLSGIFAMSGRLLFYFQVFSIAVYPSIINYLKNKSYKLLFLCVIIFSTLYIFNIFLKRENFGNHYQTYQTIFTAPKYLF